MPYVTEILLREGELLYQEGDSNNGAFIVESGEISLFKEGADGHEVERRGPGAIVGEFSILTRQPRTVSVKALTPCRIFRIPSREILKNYERIDPVLRACIETSIAFAGNDGKAQQDITAAPKALLSNAKDLLEQLNFELDIEKGLKAGAFFLHYQPIVDISTGRIAGFEALMRWQHETKGFVPPDKFIAVAENMGSIGKLTELAIMETCQTLSDLQETSAANGVFASVNISGKDIDRAGFVDFLTHALDTYDLQPEQLKLEVTETALVPNSDRAVQNLDMIRRLGCGISVDDFGTGYSNFGYLKSLPLTALKIDRAFIADLLENAVSRSIVRMLLGFGRELDVDIIAEGIESRAAVAKLHELGCRFGQGYYFHKPMAKADLIAVLNKRPLHQVVA